MAEAVIALARGQKGTFGPTCTRRGKRQDDK